MKISKHLFISVVGILLLYACEDVEFLNLKRDNPLDAKNNTNMQAGVSLKFGSYYVYSDNNDDRKVNKGETIQLNVSLKNTGTSTANGVKATFSTTSSYVSGFSPTTQISYGNISAGSTVWKGGSSYSNYDYAIQFTVSYTTPNDTQIPISISIVDESGNMWTESFNITVEGINADIVFGSYYVYSDNNGDKKINKGETIRMNVSLRNTGSSTANSVKATFSTTSSYVSGFSPTTQISYGNISAGSTVWKGGSSYSNYDYAIQFTVSNTTPNDTQIPINIIIVDESGNTWTESFNITVEGINANIVFGSYYVYSDNNGDKKINKGETIRMNVSLRNTGTSTANSVKATFSTTSSYVSGFSPTTQISYGNISAGSTVWKGGSSYSNYDYAIQFTVSNTTPNDTQIPINIIIVDESGNTWTESFNITVEGINANIVYGSYFVYSDNNGDKKINKGETIQLNVSLKNTGTSTANNVKATFSTISSYVSGFSPTTQISYGNISAGSTVWKGGSSYSNYDYAIQFTVSNTTPNDTQIPINIIIVDESNNTWSGSFNITVQ